MVWYMTWWALLLSVLAGGSVSRWGRGYSCGLLLLEFSDHSALQLIVSMGSLGPFVFGTPCFPDQVCQGLYACLCAEECCALVAWGSFVDYVPVFFVGLAFEYYVFRCLEFCAAWESDALLYVMRLLNGKPTISNAMGGRLTLRSRVQLSRRWDRFSLSTRWTGVGPLFRALI